MKEYKNYLFSLFYTLFIGAVAWLLLGIRYSDMDDVVMQALLNGTLTYGELNIYSVFNNIIFSGTIAHLYHYFPSLEWYPLAFLFLIAVSLFVLVYFVQTKTEGGKKLALLACLSLSVWFFAKLQFTLVTAYVAFAGYFLLMHWDNKKTRLILSALLLFVASTIRFEMFALVSLCILPHVVADTFQKEKIWTLGCLFVAIVCALVLHHHYYTINDDWAYFFEYNDLRGKINDNPNPNTLSQGFHQEDLEAFWASATPESFDIPLLKKIWEQTKGSFWGNEHFIDTIIRYKLVVLLSFLLLVSNILSKKYYLALYIVIFWCLIYYITINHYAKYRIVNPTIFVYTFLSIYYLRVKFHNVLSYALAIPLVLLNFFIDHTVALTNNEPYKEMERNKDKVYALGFSAVYDAMSLDPFNVRAPYNMVLDGWTVNIPINKNHKDIYYSQNMFKIKPKEGKQLVFVLDKNHQNSQEYAYKTRKIEQKKEIGNLVFLYVKE